MNGKLPLAIWLVITLAGMVPTDAAKALSRSSNTKNKSHSANADHVRLTHAVSHHNAPSRSYPHQQQHVQQSHTHNQASAPALPSHVQSNAAAMPTAKPIGWNVPQSSNTNAGFQQPHAAAAPPPPPAYSPHAPNTNAGPPPPYPANTNYNQQSADFHPGKVTSVELLWHPLTSSCTLLIFFLSKIRAYSIANTTQLITSLLKSLVNKHA